MSNPENQTPVLDPVAMAGATAQTSGFAQAGSSSSSSAQPTGASSSTLPSTQPKPQPSSPTVSPDRSRGSISAPTFSSSVATGIFPTSAAMPTYVGGPLGGGFIPLPVSGGMQSSPLVPAPGTSIDPKTGKPFSAGMTRAELEAKKASEMSGREQAARQLAGPGLSTGTSEVSTPGKELPGGWGPVQPVPPPGTGPNAPASIYEDVNTVLHKVGATAFSVLPAGLKEAISNSPDPKGKGKEGAPSSPTARRSSVATFYENVKQQTTEIIEQVRQEHNAPPPTEGGARKTSQSQQGIFGQVKGFFAEAVNEKPTGVAGAATFKTSLPSDEPLGARPGEHVSGVGALPGKANETGVAVLPDEKVGLKSAPAQENQGLLPGEVSAGVGDLPGKSDEAGVAIPPDVRAAEGSAGGLIAASGASAIQAPATTDTTGPTDTSAHKTELAPPLPHTVLGTGIGEGATDPNIITTSNTDGSVPNSATSSSALTAPPANERTDSLASVTAIRHGHSGSRDDHGQSPLAKDAITASAISEASASDAPASSTAVGSDEPSTAALSRHDESAISDAPSPVSKTADLPSTTTPSTTAATKPTENGSHAATSPTSPAPKSAALAAVGDHEKGHRRASSTSSNGKKKTGFMNKLKGEMKVISGKIGGDEAKVLAGEKLKHGEL